MNELSQGPEQLPKAAPVQPPALEGEILTKRPRASVFLFAFLILLTLVFFGWKLTRPKSFMVEPIFGFSGETQPCGKFVAWDVISIPEGFALTDIQGERILVFDHDGHYLRAITQKQAGPPPWNGLSGISSDPQGNLYVIDCWGGFIRGFNPAGKRIVLVDLHNKGFFGPRGVVWNPDSFIVADTGSHRLAKILADGVVMATWGKHGDGNGEMNDPVAVVLDKDGNFYVADAKNFRIQCLGRDGVFHWSYKLKKKAIGVALDLKKGILYASDEAGLVTALNLDGKYLGDLTSTLDKTRPLSGLTVVDVTDQGDLIALRNNREVLVVRPIESPETSMIPSFLRLGN